jgi:hypothetical protein
MRNLLVWTFALLTPLVVSAPFVQALLMEQEASGDDASRSGIGSPEQVARVLQEHKPLVIVLGNSVANAAIDEPVLSELLDVPGQLAVLHVPGSLPPTWYLLLENAVLQQGYTPKLVLIVANPPNLVEVLPASDLDFERLMAHLDGDDPVVEAALDANDGPLGWQERRRRVALRSALLDGGRDLAVGLVFAPFGEGWLLERGSGIAAGALGAVFTADGLGQDAPVAGISTRAPAFDPSLSEAVVRLGVTSGAKVVVVQPPVRRDLPENTLDPAHMAELVATVEGAGGVWLDMSKRPPPEYFANDHHLNVRGQWWFTARLGERMRAEGLVAVDGPAPRLLPLAARREGTPPTLPAFAQHRRGDRDCGVAYLFQELAFLAEDEPWDASPVVVLEDGAPLQRRGMPGAPSCDGTFRHQKEGGLAVAPAHGGALSLTLSPEVSLRPAPYRGRQWPDRWWIYPHTTLHLDVPPVEGPFELWVQAGLPGKGEAKITLEVDGVAVPMAAPGEDGRVLNARVELPGKAAPWSVRVASQGPYATLRYVAVRRQGEARWRFVVLADRRVLD